MVAFACEAAEADWDTRLNAYLKAIQDTANALPVEKTSCIMARTKLGRYMNKALLFITFSAACPNIDVSSLKWITIGETFAKANMPAVSITKLSPHVWSR